MGNSNRGATIAAKLKRPQAGQEERLERSPQRDDAPLPPLVVLKDAGAQTTVSHPVRSARKRPPLLNRLALWALLALIPYFGLCGLIAHSDFMQSVLTYAHYPRNLKNPRELQDLVSYGLISGRNIGVVRDEDGVLLRGWHVVPLAGSKKRISELANLSLANSTDEINLFYDAELARGDKPIVILLHGNTHNRAMWYRVGQVKHLSQVLDAHIVAFDYAGFGDSEGWPSEESTYRDAHAMYSWVRNAIERGRDALSNSAVCSAYPVKVCSSAPPRAKIILYGHSLGSAIALQISKDLAAANDGSSPFSGVILDAPFVTFSDAIMSHPRSAPLRVLPLVRDYLYVCCPLQTKIRSRSIALYP